MVMPPSQLEHSRPRSPSPVTGRFEKAHDQLALMQTKGRAPEPESHERKLLGERIKRVDPLAIPAAGAVPLSTQQDAAIFDAQSAQLFLHKDVSSRPADTLKESLQGEISPRGSPQAGRGGEMKALIQQEAAAAGSPASPPLQRKSPPLQQPGQHVPPAQLFQAKRVGAFRPPDRPLW